MNYEQQRKAIKLEIKKSIDEIYDKIGILICRLNQNISNQDFYASKFEHEELKNKLEAIRMLLK